MSSKYENYPFWIIAIATLLSWSLYAIGLIIFAQFGLVWALLYAAYCLWCEFHLLRRSCRHCYYYGKSCGFGKGRLCAQFFRQGEPAKFTDRKMTWRDLIPDFLVSGLPLIAGIILLICDFNWLILILLLVLIVLTSAGNSLVRMTLACKYCKQAETGCPAIDMFAGKKKNKEE